MSRFYEGWWKWGEEIAKQRQRWLTYAANSLPTSDLGDISDAALHIDTLHCPRMATQARSIASLTISFGLVAIPVKLYSATVASERVAFNLLREKDGSRVKQQYVAVSDGKPVDRSEMAKGYEFSKDQFVMFSPDEVKALEDATTHSIDISQFVPLESVDPVYFDPGWSTRTLIYPLLLERAGDDQSVYRHILAYHRLTEAHKAPTEFVDDEAPD